MKYTNRHGLPEYLAKTLGHEWYGGAGAKFDLSTTQFSNPPIMAILQKRYADSLERDVIDEYVAVLGEGFHKLCELALEGIGIVEKRAYIEIAGKIISGQVDLYLPEEQKLVDYKVTKATSFIFGGRSEKYSSQMNINKYIFGKNGFPISHLEIVELYRDWDAKTASVDPKYPPLPINIISIPVLTDAVIEYTLKEYIKEFEYYKDKPDHELVPCKKEDRWERGGEVAVKKYGAVRALRLFKTVAEAEAYRSMNCVAKDTFIEERPLVPIRCIDWCDVNKWCPFYQDFLAKKEGGSRENVAKPNKPNDIFSDLF